MKRSIFTYVLLVLVLGTLGLGFARHSQNRSAQNDRLKQQQKYRFPIAEYDEPDSPDPTKNRMRKEKQLRHNDFKIVASKPPEWQTERVFVKEGAMNFPALPVRESAYIFTGKVTAAEAHLSENKKNVVSEFTVSVSRVFKTADSSIINGGEIVVNRIGGLVKYPNGQTVLYRISQSNMPVVGERYLFFLTSRNNHDLFILTAYAITVDGVSPLDESEHFEALRGLSEEALLQKLQDSLMKTARTRQPRATYTMSY
jgi:hypothetical protein